MTRDSYRPDGPQDVAGGTRDAAAARTTKPSPAGDTTPDILEVFGSQPLVQASAAPPEAPPVVEQTPKPPSPAAESPRVVVVPAPGPVPAPPAPKAPTVPPAGASPDALHAPTRPASTPPAAPVVPTVETAIAWKAQTGDDPLATVDDEVAPQQQPRAASQPAPSALDQETVDTLLNTLRAVLEGQAHLAALAAASETRLAGVEEKVDGLEKQTAFLPPKLRGLGKKVGDLNSTLSDQRTRDLLKDVLDLGDLVDAALRSYPDDVDDAHPLADSLRLFQALDTRFHQILEANQVLEIETACDFDPEVHQAVESHPVHEAAKSGRVVEVFRRGFRTEHIVLRYAEVAVGKLVDRRRSDGEDTREDASLVAPTLTPQSPGPRERRKKGQNSALPPDSEPSPKPDAEKSDA